MAFSKVWGGGKDTSDSRAKPAEIFSKKFEKHRKNICKHTFARYNAIKSKETSGKVLPSRPESSSFLDFLSPYRVLEEEP